MTPAYLTFEIGQRVKMTEKALKQGLGRRSSTGQVTGFSAGGLGLIVKRDGLKTPSDYHPDFWQAEE